VTQTERTLRTHTVVYQSTLHAVNGRQLMTYFPQFVKYLKNFSIKFKKNSFHVLIFILNDLSSFTVFVIYFYCLLIFHILLLVSFQSYDNYVL